MKRSVKKNVNKTWLNVNFSKIVIQKLSYLKFHQRNRHFYTLYDGF